MADEVIGHPDAVVRRSHRSFTRVPVIEIAHDRNRLGVWRPNGKIPKLYDLSGYRWKDRKWMKDRENYNPYGSPMNIYEMHFGSWRRYDDGNFI